jgi:hypothetical protein
MMPEPHTIGAGRLSCCLSPGIGNGKHEPQPGPPLPPQGGASGLDAYLGSRRECESDQPERDGHVCYDFILHCRDGGRVRRGWTSADPSLKSASRAASPRYAQVIEITQTHLGAGAAMVQPFFFCASNHSVKPGWGSLAEGARLASKELWA